MIRNVVLVKLAPGQDPAAVARAQQAFLNLNCTGTLSYAIGDDLRLRDGNWSFAIVADFADADAYRAYDQDEEHNRARAGLLPMTEQIPGCRTRASMLLSRSTRTAASASSPTATLCSGSPQCVR
jgi:hypothetical protein